MEPVTSGTIPIIRLYRDLIVIVHGSLTDAAVAQVKEDTTREIERHDARGLIISVSGVDLMDSYISRTIYDIALIAKYMGVETVVCGIGPIAATTLVDMGMGLSGVTTELNLERALETLYERRRARSPLELEDDDDDDDGEWDDEWDGEWQDAAPAFTSSVQRRR
ncbi:MAG TPA: STAS domain-containing protein [Kofleriaceae bacterium]|nr:STAS domain-containing protein [Kofleriaceae bacterium]